MQLRPISAAELPAFLRTSEAAFGRDLRDEDVPLVAKVFEPERSLAVFDGSDMVATTCLFSRELTVPGATVPAACVSAVGVLPTHRRRGLLSRLMRRQLGDVQERGEPLAVLWASEAGIYGQFGYGLAAQAGTVTLRTAGVRLHPLAPQPSGRTALVVPADAVERMAPLYEAVRVRRPGHLDRAGAWWEHRLHDPAHEREGASALRAVLHHAADGTPDGYALYAIRPRDAPDGADGELLLHELVADGPRATAALWAYLLGIDLIRTVRWTPAPADEPLLQLIAGPQHARVELSPNLWLRIVDVGRALPLRRLAAPVDVVLELDDELCPWNAGRVRLAGDSDGATCARTTAPADVTLPIADLAAAYLGGPTLAALAAAGRVRELRPGALAQLDLALRAPRAPWCADEF